VRRSDSKLIAPGHPTESLEGSRPSFDFPLVERKGKPETKVPVNDGVEPQGNGTWAVTRLEQEPQVSFDESGGCRNDLMEAVMNVSVGDKGAPVGKVR
jgi:hypothetical protein